MDEMQKAQDDLKKGFGFNPEAPANTDAVAALNTSGIADLRKGAGASESSSKEDDKKDDKDKDKDDTQKSGTSEAKVLSAEEVFSSVIKNADGQLVSLVEGDKIVSDLVKGFSRVVADQHNEIVELRKSINGITDNQILQNRAIVAFRDQNVDLFKGLVDVLKDAPASSTARLALSNLLATVVEKKADAEETPAGTGTIVKTVNGGGSEDVDKAKAFFGGYDAGQLFTITKNALQDPETAKKYRLSNDHLLVKRRGIQCLPKEFREEFIPAAVTKMAQQ